MEQNSNLGAALLLAVGLGLLAVGLPLAVAHAYAARHGDTITAINQGRTPEDYTPALRDYAQAVKIFPDPRLLRDRALMELSALRHAGGAVQTAEQALRASLVRAPLDPFAWARLAVVAELKGDEAQTHAALVQSLTTGAYLTGFMQWRFLMLAQHWPHMGAEQQALIAQQALVLNAQMPRRFSSIANMPTLKSAIDAMMNQQADAPTYRAFVALRDAATGQPPRGGTSSVIPKTAPTASAGAD